MRNLGKTASRIKKPRTLKKPLLTQKQSRTLFVIIMLAYPMVHFVSAWYNNLNMIPMAFMSYSDSVNGEFLGWDNLFGNFKGVINLYTGEHRVTTEWTALKNTMSLYLLDIFINIPLSLIFTYLLYAKTKGWRTWQSLLYMPNITSSIVLVLVFRAVILGGPLNTVLNQMGKGDVIPYEGWLGPNNAWTMILIFSVWTGISSNIVYYLASMRRIPQDVIEAAQLEGATEYQIFFKIVFPLILPQVVTLVFLGFGSNIAWATPSLLMMDSTEGYNGTGAIGLSLLNWANNRNFGIASAYGVMVTAIMAPILMTMRKLSEKITEKLQ